MLPITLSIEFGHIVYATYYKFGGCKEICTPISRSIQFRALSRKTYQSDSVRQLPYLGRQFRITIFKLYNQIITKNKLLKFTDFPGYLQSANPSNFHRIISNTVTINVAYLTVFLPIVNRVNELFLYCHPF
jgi:hypothetical protein